MTLLSQLSDTSVLPIVGYSEEEGEQILVFLRLPSAVTLRKALDQNSCANMSPHFLAIHGCLCSDSCCASSMAVSGGRSLTLSQRIDIGLGIANGLSYLHKFSDSHKVIHGNLNSTNVLLTSDLTVRHKTAQRNLNPSFSLSLTRKFSFSAKAE